jgi:molybdenum cofactor cytidylyltransferase
MKISGIILAAGSSSRMPNQNKLMAKINGKTILESVLDTALMVDLSQVIVVLGSNAEQLSELLIDYPVTQVINDEWEKGMSSSIKTGVEKLEDDINGTMIILGDMPGVRANDLQLLLNKFVEHEYQKIVYPARNNQQGHPVIFPKKYFKELVLLTGDRGAKSILNEKNSIGVDINSQGIIMDIDTESDLKTFLSQKT